MNKGKITCMFLAFYFTPLCYCAARVQWMNE